METPGRNRVRFLDGDADTTSTLEMGAQRDVDGGEWGGSVVPNQSFDLQEDPSFWKDNSVQVVIRVRPLSSNEISLHGPKKCVRQDSSQTITWTGHPECRFTFDHVADGYVTQERLFKVAGVPMIDNCVAGYNSCMFAYGQTGSGKTYTMLGDIEGGTRRHSVDAGITPRVFEYLFSRIQREKESQREEKLRFTCKCSFLEIYNEHILDLLEPSSANLQIREDMRKGVYVENLKEVEVSSARDVIQQLVQGSTNRKVASTSMNHASSRSHSVFTCIIESKWESQGVIHHRFARLNLVDLAGSERQKTSGAEGERLKEATNINKSLSTLGLVIMNLVSNSKQKSLHVPYRDSKLTFLLQDSLGGNSKTLIIANISPSNWCALETLSTLKFAQRAKFIRNNAIVNEDASGDVIAMRLEIQQLKREVSRLQGLVCVGAKEDVGGISACFTGSPGSFKWDGLHSSFSPLTLDKRLSLGKESEAALVASLKREQEKDKMIKALAVGRQAAEQLATQKSEEVQGLKMRLRFREERIKNLESRTTGPFSDASLQLEKDNLRKEIEILRNQIDRNPEITRFAMETLNVKEELRRMQSLVAEGQEERINEMSGEITILRDKLLEALEWKMMHEKDVNGVQELSASWDASAEEIELLKLQAIQYERNWAACLEEKQKLERHVQELVSQLEKVKTMKAVNEDKEAVVASHGITPVANDSLDDQVGLRTMVEAISAASQREAEAHETAIILARENEDLHTKLKDLIKEKEKMIEFYENVIAEGSNNKSSNDIPVNNECNDASKETKHLYDQLHEMQEENEKLMGLYEQAMQERDEFKRLLYSTTQEKTQAAANVADSSWSLRKAVLELDKLTTRIETVDHDIQVKQQDMASLKHYSNEGRYRKSVTENKLLALGHILQNFSNSKVQYWAEREEQAKSRTNACLRYIEKKKEELAEVQSSKFKCDAAYSKSARLEAQLREKLNSVKQEIQNLENKKKESEKVLFSIENIEKTDLSSQRMNFGKASELLKSEEERTKLLVEMKQLRENLASLQREMVTQKRTSETWDAKIENLEEKLRSGAAALKEEESRLCKANEEEKEMVSQMEDVNGELEMLLVDYQEVIFQSLLKEAEGKLLVEEVEQQMEELEWLKSAQRLASEKMKTVLMEERVPSPQPELLRACFLDDCPTL